MKSNILFLQDSYKFSHYLQYPKGTEFVNSYISPRGKVRSPRFTSTMFFGLQMFIKEYLEGEVITQEMLNEAKDLIPTHGLSLNVEGFQYIIDKHKGHLPVKIQAVREGTVLNNGNIVLQIQNTDPKCYWLTSFLETMILRGIWYPSTVATVSWSIKKLIKDFLEETADNLEGLGFKLHDFGYRGVSSHESGCIGGLSHLVNFLGTDNVGSLEYGRKYYNENCAGFSIDASEHSSITPWGKDNEVEAYRNMLKQFSSKGIFACVSDSFDIKNACENLWGGELKQEVIDSGAVVIVRPDSGDPVETPIEVVEILAEKFGTTRNTKGYLVLNNVRVIQGDGIDYNDIKSILYGLKARGYSADNIAFGMGNNLLQNLNRDTCNFSMKCSEIVANGVKLDVQKESPGKVSKKGRLALVERNEELITIREDELVKGSHGSEKNYLEPVFENGKLLFEENFSDIRERSNNY